MQIARVRSILWAAAGLATAGTILVVIANLTIPLGSSAGPTDQPPPFAKSALPVAVVPRVLPLSSFESAWQVPLRRPLVDPPPTSPLPGASVEETAKPPLVAIRLIGTIVDGQHPRGVFMTGLSTVELKSIGDHVGNATVMAIDDNSATLSYQDSTITLHREKKPFDPSGESYEAAHD